MLPGGWVTNVAALGGVTDPHSASTVFLAGFNGADGATSFTSEDSSARTVTFVADAQLDTAQQKFGTASLLLDGTGDYCTVPDSADWEFGGEFTIECFIRPANITAGVRGILAHMEGAALGWAMYQNAGTLSFQLSTNGSTAAYTITSASVMSANTWHHVAVDRDGTGKVRLYIDGVMRASTASGAGASANVASTLKIGNRFGSLFLGHIDEPRITNGVARFASDSGLSVPTAEFPRS